MTTFNIIEEQNKEFVNPGHWVSPDGYSLTMRDSTGIYLIGGVFDGSQGTNYPAGVDAGIIANCRDCVIEGATFIGSSHPDRQAVLLWQSHGIVMRRCLFLLPTPKSLIEPFGKRGLCIAGDNNIIEECVVAFLGEQYGPRWPATSDGSGVGITIYGGDYKDKPYCPRGNIINRCTIVGPTAYGIGISGGGNKIEGAFATQNIVSNNVIHCRNTAYAGIYTVNNNDEGKSRNHLLDNTVFGGQCGIKNRGMNTIADGVVWRGEAENITFNDVSHEDSL
jgi:hypothetical protein